MYMMYEMWAHLHDYEHAVVNNR